MSEPFEPLIIGFTCNWCSYRAADLAGISRKKYPPNIRLIRLMCSGRLDPSFVLKAFAGGADGVLVSGCHPGECHYLEQNYKMLRRFVLLKRLIAQMGIEPQRLKLLWASAAEGIHFAEEVADMVEEIRKIGPLNWAGNDHVRLVAEGLRRSGDGIPGPETVEVEAKPAAKVAKPAGPPRAGKPVSLPGVKKAGPPSAKKPAGPPKVARAAGPPGTTKPSLPPGKPRSAPPSSPDETPSAKTKEV